MDGSLEVGAATGLPAAVDELLDSARYLTQCLTASLATRWTHASRGRLQLKWKLLQPWVRNAAQLGAPPKGLFDHIFEPFEAAWTAYTCIPDTSATSVSDVEYVTRQVEALSSEVERQTRALLLSAVYRS